MNRTRLATTLILAVNVGVWLSCAPKFVFVDRPTIMEEVAAGEWPDLEANLLKRSTKKTASLVPKEKQDPENQESFQVLKGEFTHSDRIKAEAKK